MPFILLNQLSYIFFVLHVLSSFVESELFEIVVFFLSQRNTLRCEQLLNDVYMDPTCVLWV